MSDLWSGSYSCAMNYFTTGDAPAVGWPEQNNAFCNKGKGTTLICWVSNKASSYHNTDFDSAVGSLFCACL